MAGDHLAHQVGHQLKRAQQALRGRMDEGLRELGLTAPQYAILSILEEAPGLSGAELARRAFVTPQTMNPILIHLETIGWVERLPHPAHGRVINTYLTGRGQAVLERAHAVVYAIEARMLDGVGEEQARRLAEQLGECAKRLEQAAPAAS